MRNRTLLRTGVGGGIIAAICCFTPALVIVLGAVGLTAWLAWLDFVLLPALALFVGIAIYAAVRMARKPPRKTQMKEPS